jgi:hypothetical protein
VIGVLVDELAENLLGEAGLEEVGAVRGGCKNALVSGYDGIGHVERVRQRTILRVGMRDGGEKQSGCC